MPSNRTLKPRFKPHVGRVFFLRKCATIPAYDVPKACWNQTQEFLDRESMFGSGVLVMDETNTRVCVTKVDGTVCWIQKYYLHKEVPSPCLETKDNQVEAIASILEIAKKIKTTTEPLTIKDADKLEKAAQLWRTVVDKVE